MAAFPSQSNPIRLTIAALVVAVLALVVAVWALMRAPGSGDPVTAEQTAEAKTQVCGAFDIVRAAVSLQTNANLGDDKVAVQAVAANARLATLGGGEFLLSRLNDAVPSDLADAVRSFANNLQYVGMGQLAGAPGDDAAQVQQMNDAQASATRITELCK